jgi:hypothetical protein
MNEKHFAVAEPRRGPAPVTRRTEALGGLQDAIDEIVAILRDEWRGLILGAGLVLAVVAVVMLTGSST